MTWRNSAPVMSPGTLLLSMPAAHRSFFAISCTLLFLLAASACAPQQAGAPHHDNTRREDLLPGHEQARTAPEPATEIMQIANGRAKVAQAKRFMAVTANPHASSAAQAVLADGGSAIDAALAAQMVLGLVEPQSSGLGGGGFLLYWDAQQRRLFSYDGRETAPLAADESLFIDPDNGERMNFGAALVGGRSVGVPGMMRMLEMAHAAHGVKPWHQLFEPAMQLARRGFAVSPRLASLVASVPALKVRRPMREYLHAGGENLQAGSVLRNAEYAQTLAVLAAQGSDALYGGDIANTLVSRVNEDENPGTLSVYDMLVYRAVSREPVCQVIFAYRICGMGPPSSGATTVLGILGMLEALPGHDQAEPGVAAQATLAHRFVEASRLAFADRNYYLGDPDFVAVPVAGLIDKSYLGSRAELISDLSRLAQPAAGEPQGGLPRSMSEPLELASTTHLSIVDAQGNIASMTTSIESAFGSRLMSNGFILNNQLTDFSFLPRDADNRMLANRVQGGKRPLSSMSPMIVFDAQGEPVMALGSPGGKSIIGFVARVLYETLAQQRGLAEAIAAPHIVATGTALGIEPTVDNAVQEKLRALGHQPEIRAQTSGISAVQRREGGWLGVADPRREGAAAGG
ncbi:MAG: gamma-glutamyltransferase family protein [Pseudomonadales bacterium]